jgi:hypothetical protein
VPPAGLWGGVVWFHEMDGEITLRHGTGPLGRGPFRATSLDGGAKRYCPRWGVEDHPRALARLRVPPSGLWGGRVCAGRTFGLAGAYSCWAGPWRC